MNFPRFSFRPSRLALLVAILGFAGVTAPLTSKAALLTYFNFNDSIGPVPPPIVGLPPFPGIPDLTSDAPGTQVTMMTTDFPIVTGTTVEAGTTTNRAAGDLSAETWALQLSGAYNNRFIQFTFSTLGVHNLALSYATLSTAGGFTNQTLSFSLDNINFIPFTVNVPTTTWTTATFDLTPFVFLNNQPTIALRLTFTGATTSTGSNLIDNVQITGVPEPATLSGGILAVGALFIHQRRRLSRVLCLRRTAA
jgi:hypothetical protein